MDVTEISFLAGRLLIGGYFLFNGIVHIVQFKQMVGYTAIHGIPFPKMGVVVATVLILIGGLGVVLGVYPTISLYALVLFMVPVTFSMHAFWKITDPNERRIERVQFLKNMALLGAILMLLGLETPWPLSLM